MKLTTFLGWVGMAAVAIAFLLNSHEFVASTAVLYLAMNLGGAIFMGVNLWANRMFWSGPFALQIFWGFVSLNALAKALA